MAIKNVLITGCNRGIGFKLCKQLCRLSTTQTMIATTRRPQNATELSAQRVDNLETNAVAPLMLTKKLLPLLITSAKNMEPTSVVNMSSTLGSMKSNIIKGQQYYPYRISKAGLNMMTKSFKSNSNGGNTLIDEFTIRLMEEKDMNEALEVFASHGLYESLSTLQAFYECDPNAFYVAISNSENKVIGVCGSPVTTHSSGFLGLYGVEKRYQSRGIGKILFNLCLKHIGNRNCGLHAVPEKLLMYQKKAGFAVSEGRAMVVFGGIPKNLDNLLMTVNTSLTTKEFKRDDKSLLSKIINYDTKVHKDNRQKLLTLTLNKEDYYTIAIIDENNDQLLGYGSIRPNCGNQGMIGPVYADNDSVAQVLILNLIKCCKLSQTNGLLYMTLDSSETGVKIGQNLGLEEHERCQRVFTKYVTPANHQFIYCLHSPNFSL